MGPSLFFPGLPLNENTRKTIAQRIRALFAGSIEGAWYDPSDLSTMFQTIAVSSGTQDRVTATGQSVGLILDKSKGLALGAPIGSNMDFASAGTGWSVSGSDGTHIATFGTGSCRYQSDTQSPQLVVSRAPGATANTIYRVDVTVSAYVSGQIRVSMSSGTHEVAVPTGVGTHTVYVYATNNSIAFFRAATNVDLTISSIVVRAVAGNHAIQATSGSRPVFRDVGGYRYLEFDGVDDYLRSTFTIAQPIDRISALQQVTWIDGTRIYGGVALDRALLFRGTVSPRIFLYSGLANPAIDLLAVGANGVVTERHSGATSRIAVGNSAYAVADSGTGLPGGITIGAGSGPALFSNMHLYQLIERGGPTALTDAQISACRALCAIKSGVTL